MSGTKLVTNLVAITGPRWTTVQEAVHHLERARRVMPNLQVVTQSHFRPKVAAWAREHKVPLFCIDETNKYRANELLVASQAAEFILVHKDSAVDHLKYCLSKLTGVVVRTYP